MSEELKLNENVSAPQPDALAQIARKDDFLQQLQEFLAQNAYEMKLDNGTYQIYE